MNRRSRRGAGRLVQAQTGRSMVSRVGEYVNALRRGTDLKSRGDRGKRNEGGRDGTEYKERGGGEAVIEEEVDDDVDNGGREGEDATRSRPIFGGPLGRGRGEARGRADKGWMFSAEGFVQRERGQTGTFFSDGILPGGQAGRRATAQGASASRSLSVVGWLAVLGSRVPQPAQPHAAAQIGLPLIAGCRGRTDRTLGGRRHSVFSSRPGGKPSTQHRHPDRYPKKKTILIFAFAPGR
jgi:hypothetical protein